MGIVPGSIALRNACGQLQQIGYAVGPSNGRRPNERGRSSFSGGCATIRKFPPNAFRDSVEVTSTCGVATCLSMGGLLAARARSTSSRPPRSRNKSICDARRRSFSAAC